MRQHGEAASADADTGAGEEKSPRADRKSTDINYMTSSTWMKLVFMGMY